MAHYMKTNGSKVHYHYPLGVLVSEEQLTLPYQHSLRQLMGPLLEQQNFCQRR